MNTVRSNFDFVIGDVVGIGTNEPMRDCAVLQCDAMLRDVRGTYMLAIRGEAVGQVIAGLSAAASMLAAAADPPSAGTSAPALRVLHCSSAAARSTTTPNECLVQLEISPGLLLHVSLPRAAASALFASLSSVFGH